MSIYSNICNNVKTAISSIAVLGYLTLYPAVVSAEQKTEQKQQNVPQKKEIKQFDDAYLQAQLESNLPLERLRAAHSYLSAHPGTNQHRLAELVTKSKTTRTLEQISEEYLQKVYQLHFKDSKDQKKPKQIGAVEFYLGKEACALYRTFEKNKNTTNLEKVVSVIEKKCAASPHKAQHERALDLYNKTVKHTFSLQQCITTVNSFTIDSKSKNYYINLFAKVKYREGRRFSFLNQYERADQQFHEIMKLNKKDEFLSPENFLKINSAFHTQAKPILDITPEKNTGKKDALTEALKKLGDKKTYSEPLPLNIECGSFDALMKSESQKEDAILLLEGVEVWQESNGKRILDLRCDQAVIWPGDKSHSRKKSENTLETEFDLENSKLYAEGGVIFQFGGRTYTGDQLYYNIKENKGIVMNATMRGERTFDNKTVPLHMRSEKLHIHSEEQVTAENAQVSTCQFGDPHYHLAVSNVEIIKRKDAHGNEKTDVKAHGNTLYAGSVPVFYLPYATDQLFENVPLKSAEYLNTSVFGNAFKTIWQGNLFEKDSKEKGIMERVDWQLLIDIYENRGIGVGPQVHYKGAFAQDQQFQGFVNLYYLNDKPLSDLFSGKDSQQSDETLYRIYGLHRQQLPNGWKLDAELSDIADETFFFEFFEEEAREQKSPETYVNVKKIWRNQGASLFANVNLNDFQNQNQYLPRGSYHLIQQPLGEDIFGGALYWSSDIDVANIIPQGSNDLGVDRLFRADWKNTLNYKFTLADIFFRPHISNRLTYFEKTLNSSDAVRSVFTSGIDVSTNFYRMFPVKIDLLGIDNVMHIITPQINYKKVDTSIDPSRLIPVDGIEEIENSQKIRFGVLNRFKTLRNGLFSDFFYLDANLVYDLNSEKSGLERFSAVEAGMYWNIMKNVHLNATAEYNLVDSDFEKIIATIQVKPSDDASLLVGLRYNKTFDLLATMDLKYQLSPKWAVEIESQYDFTEKQFLYNEVRLERFFHDLSLYFAFRHDPIVDETSFKAGINPLHLFRK